jgi:hypothetical protein
MTNKLITMGIKLLIVFSFLLLSVSCDQIYKGGNRQPMLDLTIERNVDQKIILNFLDSVEVKDRGRFSMPRKYDFLR